MTLHFLLSRSQSFDLCLKFPLFKPLSMGGIQIVRLEYPTNQISLFRIRKFYTLC